MSRYRFRLEQVLRVRRIQEDRAKAEMALARLDANKANETLQERLGAYHEAQLRKGPSDRVEFEADRAARERLAATVTAARLAEANALLVLDSTAEQWRLAAREVERLERLDDRRRGEHEQEERREEQKLVDDMVSARFEKKP